MGLRARGKAAIAPLMTQLNILVTGTSRGIGAATVELEDVTGVEVAAVSEEGSVTDVLGKVASGQADAGVVYRTDVTSAGDQVEEIEIPDADRAVNRYPISVLTDSEDQDLAQEFSDFVRSDTGRERLEQEGFGAP